MGAERQAAEITARRGETGNAGLIQAQIGEK